MDINAIKEALGLPPEATEEQVMTAIKAGAQAIEELATERTKAEAAEAEKGQAEEERDEANARGWSSSRPTRHSMRRCRRR